MKRKIKRLNFFGREGFLAESERKEKLEHMIGIFMFSTNTELSSPIKVSTITKVEVVSLSDYSEAVGLFHLWWSTNILPDLNGFNYSTSFECDFEVENRKDG